MLSQIPFIIAAKRLLEIPSDGYRAFVEDGTLFLYASTEWGFANALSRIEYGYKAGHLRQYLGSFAPMHPVRALWVQQEVEDLSFAVQLGYNTVIVPNVRGKKDARLHYYLAAAPDFFTLQPWEKLLSEVEGVFWRAECRLDPLKTRLDCVLQELKSLENSLGDKRLLFYIPYKEWFATRDALLLLQEAGPRTIICFSSVKGEPEKVYLPEHPLWEALRSSSTLSHTPLLPIFNSGSIGVGEGLWPVVNLSCIDKHSFQMKSRPFYGAIHLFQGSLHPLLKGALWAACQTSFDHRLAQEAFHTFLQGWWQKPDASLVQEVFFTAQSIAFSLRQWIDGSSAKEGMKFLAEKLLSELFLLKQMPVGQELGQMVSAFLLDACAMLQMLAQKHYVPLPQLSKLQAVGAGMSTKRPSGAYTFVEKEPLSRFL